MTTPTYTPSPTPTPMPSPSMVNVQQLFRRYKDGTLVAQVEGYKPFYGYQYIQASPSQQWNVPHFKSQVAIYNIFNSNNELIIPENITELDNCNTKITFNSPIAGFANIIFLAGKNTGMVCDITPTPSVTSSPTNISYDQVIEADTPMAYWPFNSNYDDVINGNNLTPVSGFAGIDFISDAYGHYLYFDSPNSGFQFNNIISLSSNFSLEAWVEIEAWSAAPPSDEFFTIFGTNIFGFQFGGNNNLNGTLYLFGHTDAISPSFIFEQGTIYHVVVTVDSAKNVIFYINGNAYSGNAALTETYNFNYLGTDNSNEYFYGMIGNPAIYNYVLTQQQISIHYNVGLNNYRYGGSIILPTPSPTPQPTLTAPLLSQTPTPTPSLSAPAANLIRLTSNGILDSGYSPITTDFPVVSINEINNLIYIGGVFSTVNGNTYNDLCRLTSSGILDTTFTNIPIFNTINCIYQNTDGYIYLGGGILYQNVNRGILRLNSDGTIDSTYSLILSGGVALGVTSLLPSSTATGAMIAIGQFTSGSYNDFARLNPDGTLDTTYTPITIGGTNALPICAIKTTDGHIYVGGQFTQVNGNSSRSYLIRLNSDGSLDTTFTDLGLNGQVSGLCQTTDGHIYAIGFMTNNAIRLNSDGTIDSAFTSPISFLPASIMQAVDGHIYVSGYSTPVIRLNSDGTFDFTFIPIGVSSQSIIYQTSDGNIYVGH